MEDEMVGWHHRLKGHESEQTLRDSEGRGAWRAAVHGVTESDTTELLQNSNGKLQPPPLTPRRSPGKAGGGTPRGQALSPAPGWIPTFSLQTFHTGTSLVAQQLKL